MWWASGSAVLLPPKSSYNVVSMFQIQIHPALPIHHGFSTKADGNMSYLWGEFDAVYANRQKFATQFGVALEECVFMATHNSDTIVRVDSADKGRGTMSREDGVLADALITNDPSIALALLVADCIPIIILDPAHKALGLAHGHWQSTELQIAAKTVQAMAREFGSDPADLQVFVGPSITPTQHRFKDVVQKTLPGWEPFLHEDTDGLTAVDVFGYNRHQLIQAGVPAGSIFASGVDTVSDLRFFFHYRDSREDPAQEGRFVCMVKLLPDSQNDIV